MKGRDVLIAFIVLVVIIAAVLIAGKKKVNILSTPTATPTILQQIQSKFSGLTIPQGEPSIDLKNVSGGQAMGIATRSEILADLPVPPAGQYYQGWLGNGQKLVLIGTLRNAKGGWILDYNSSKFPGYNQIVVTLAGKHILEGSF
jgi:hypothetical protein